MSKFYTIVTLASFEGGPREVHISGHTEEMDIQKLEKSWGPRYTDIEIVRVYKQETVEYKVYDSGTKLTEQQERVVHQRCNSKEDASKILGTPLPGRLLLPGTTFADILAYAEPVQIASSEYDHRLLRERGTDNERQMVKVISRLKFLVTVLINHVKRRPHETQD